MLLMLLLLLLPMKKEKEKRMSAACMRYINESVVSICTRLSGSHSTVNNPSPWRDLIMFENITSFTSLETKRATHHQQRR